MANHGNSVATGDYSHPYRFDDQFYATSNNDGANDLEQRRLGGSDDDEDQHYALEGWLATACTNTQHSLPEVTEVY